MSYCKITFCGLNSCKLVNNLCNCGIQVVNFQKQGQTCLLTVRQKHYRRVVAYLNEKCYNIVKVEHFGAFQRKNFAKRHFVAIAMIFLFVVAVAVTSNFCCKIKVVGDFDEQLVLNELANCGVRLGTNLSKTDVTAIQNALANKLDAMYVVLTVKSSTLHVQAVAKRVANTPVDMHAPRDIVATSDGVVDYLLCEQGTPLVGVGDTVKKGQTLISGVRTFGDGSTEQVYAVGKVVLTLSKQGFAPYTGVLMQSQPTGKKQTVTKVVLFGKSYGKSCVFDNYTTSITSKFLYPLNVQIQKVTYYQTCQVAVFATLQECLPTLYQQSLQLATQDCPFAVTNTTFQVSQKGVIATVFGKLEIF